LPPALQAAEAWARGVIEPLTRTIAEQQQQLVSQAETIGRLTAELEATAAEAIALKVRQSRLEDSAAGHTEQVVVLGEERARLTAELAAACAAVDELKAAQAQQEAHQPAGDAGTSTEPPTPWWRRWRAWLAAGLVVAVVALLLAAGAVVGLLLTSR
jgi:hypothetical protein